MRSLFALIAVGIASICAPSYCQGIAASVSRGSVTEAQRPPFRYEHKAGFTVTTIGTSAPEPVIGRSAPSTLIQFKDNYFLVDVGSGTTERLVELGIPLASIHNVLFTHHHADHNDGYIKFVINSWMAGRKSLTLVGPEKTRELHEMIVKFYHEDLAYRSTLSSLPLDAMYKPDIRQYAGRNTFVLDGVTISTAGLVHTMYDLGYRFEVDGKSIVVSGDTSFSPELIELAKNADVLVMDSGLVPRKSFIGASDPVRKGEPRREPAPKHADMTSVPPHPQPGAVAKMAIAAKVKKLVLTHFPPFELDEDAIVKELRDAGYQGEILLGKDLMEITP